MRARVRAVDSWVRAADSEGGEDAAGVIVTAMVGVDVVGGVLWCVVDLTRLRRGHLCRSLAASNLRHRTQRAHIHCAGNIATSLLQDVHCHISQYSKLNLDIVLHDHPRKSINAQTSSPASEQSHVHIHSSSSFHSSYSKAYFHICVCITTLLLCNTPRGRAGMLPLAPGRGTACSFGA